MLSRLWLASFALVFSIACARTAPSTGSTPSTSAVRIPVTIDAEKGTITIQAEVVDTPPTRQRGLMFRKQMGDAEGMLFLFPNEQHLSFWMHNTLIPLDMVFIKSDRTILGVVENATPETDTPRQVPGDAQFVLEVNGGVAGKQGIKAGQSVAFYAPLPST